MATLRTILLPTGYTRISGGPSFDNIRLGRPGRWAIDQQNPYAIWEFDVSYKRGDVQGDFDAIYAFFLNSAAAYAFLVDDPFDNTSTSKNGSGVVEQINGTYRLTKHYTFGDLTYVHPITRPKNDVALGGGAAAGTLDPDTGIVTGISSDGTWTGGFYRPMIFTANKLNYDLTPGNIVDAINVPLQEQIEISFE